MEIKTNKETFLSRNIMDGALLNIPFILKYDIQTLE